MKYLHLLNATAATALLVLVVMCMIAVCFIGAPLILVLVIAIKALSWLSETGAESLRKYKEYV